MASINVKRLANECDSLRKKQVTDNEIQAPMDKGTKIGTATITLADDKLGYLEENKEGSFFCFRQ